MSETVDDATYKNVKETMIFLEIMILVFAFVIPLSIINGKNLSLTYNPTIVNGILTATAILFGFAANEIGRFKHYQMRLLTLVPLLFALALTVQWYFSDTVSGHNPTILTLYLSIAVFSLSLYTVLLVTIYKNVGL